MQKKFYGRIDRDKRTPDNWVNLQLSGVLVFLFLFRYIINPTGMEWMTFTNPFHTEIQTFQSSKPFKSF